VRNAVLLGIFALLALLLQTAVFPGLTAGRAAPDLLLILCVYLGLHQHSAAGAFGAFLLGYLEDAVSGSVIGLNAFAMCLVYLLVYLTSRHLWVDNAISKIVVVFIAAAVKTAAVLTLVAVFLSEERVWTTLLPRLSIEAVLAALLSPPMFAILSRIYDLAAVEDE